MHKLVLLLHGRWGLEVDLVRANHNNICIGVVSSVRIELVLPELEVQRANLECHIDLKDHRQASDSSYERAGPTVKTFLSPALECAVIVSVWNEVSQVTDGCVEPADGNSQDHDRAQVPVDKLQGLPPQSVGVETATTHGTASSIASCVSKAKS